MVPGRVAGVVATLLLVTFGVSLMVALMPGDPARIVAGEYATEDTVAQVREQLGLDDNVVARYVGYLGGLLRGDLGTSVQMQAGRPVSEMIAETLPVTLSLTVAALLVAVVIAVPAGYLAAARPGSRIDRTITALSAVTLAFPQFLLGLLLVAVFAIQLPVFPALGYVPAADSPGEWAWHLVLPAITLGSVSAAEIARQVRGAFVDTLEEDYIRVVEAKGMPRWRVVWRNALRNASPPILTVVGLQATRVVGAAVVIERIFALPGMGSLAYDSVFRRDLPVMQGIVLVSALIVIVFNIAVDVAQASVNPKLRAHV